MRRTIIRGPSAVDARLGAAAGEVALSPGKEHVTLRRLLGHQEERSLLAVVGLLVAAAAAFGISNLATSGHSGHLGVTAARADSGDGGDNGDGGDSDGGPQGPWTSFYAKESSHRPITMAELHQAAQQAAAIPAPGQDALAADRPDERRRPGGRPRR